MFDLASIMDEIIEEQVAVLAGTSGVPSQVVWRGRRYPVVGRPVPWIDRNPWWALTAERLPQVVEQPMWTATLATPETGDTIEVELSVTAGDWWRLERLRGQ